MPRIRKYHSGGGAPHVHNDDDTITWGEILESLVPSTEFPEAVAIPPKRVGDPIESDAAQKI